MTCDVCKQDKTGLFWVSGPTGTHVLCNSCAEPLQTHLRKQIDRLRRCLTVDSLLCEALGAALSIAHADMGNIQVADNERVLRIRIQSGFQKEFLEFFSGVKENEAACGMALVHRKTIVVEDVERSPIFIGTPSMEILLNAGVRAVQSTPMFTRSGELIGMLSTHYRKPHQFLEPELRSVSFLATETGVVLEGLVLPKTATDGRVHPMAFPGAT